MSLDRLLQIILDEVLTHQSGQKQLPPMQAPHERPKVAPGRMFKEVEVLAVRTEPPEPFDPEEP